MQSTSLFPRCAARVAERATTVLRFGTIAVAGAYLALSGAAASAETLSRSVDVDATPSAVWALIGPFCAIRDWLPPVGSCSEDGAVPPSRTLVTRDGQATFVERQTARSETQYFYSYTFLSSPLPVTEYSSTIQVTARGHDRSTVTWTGSYVPVAGKEQDAQAALEGIYTAGLESIRQQAQAATRSTP